MSEGAWKISPVDRKTREVFCRACEAERTHVGIFPDVLPYQAIHIQIPFQYTAVVDRYATAVAIAQPIGNSEIAGDDGPSFFEEEPGFDGVQKNHIIIKKYKLFGKIGDAMQIQFDGSRLERRQIFGGDIILVIHEPQLRIRFVKPVRFLSAGDEIHPVDPWCKALDRKSVV